MKYNRFEELPVWKDAIELAVSTFALTARPCFRRHAGTRNQLENAVVSISNNIAEGFERNGIPEFLHFLRIANASCAEVRSQLYAAFDEGYLASAALPGLLDETKVVSRVIRGLEKSLIAKLGTGHRARGTNRVS